MDFVIKVGNQIHKHDNKSDIKQKYELIIYFSDGKHTNSALIKPHKIHRIGKILEALQLMKQNYNNNKHLKFRRRLAKWGINLLVNNEDDQIYIPIVDYKLIYYGSDGNIYNMEITIIEEDEK